jgi:predicted nucleic acid-binding protein
MPFVLDASVAAAWFFADEDDAAATQAVTRLAEDKALVPALFWFEIRNLLVVGERRGRATVADTARFLAHLDGLPIEEDGSPSSVDLLALARAHALSAYDAAYLELARRRAVPLATLDRRLATAAAAEGNGLLGTG